MLDILRKAFNPDRDYPQRTHDLDWRRKVLRGTLYDCLTHEFHEEWNASGEYIPVAKRKPSARFALCKTVVRDSIALLFGEARFPTIECEDTASRELLVDIIRETQLARVMTEAAHRGSIGSVVIRMRVLRNRVFFDALDTVYLTPEYDPLAPDTLTKVTERYKVGGSTLITLGYSEIEPENTYWFKREWDETDEIWYLPQSIADARDGKPMRRDVARSVTHSLGFVPLVWIRNLPGADEPDGCPTFPDEVVRTQIEIDYLLSQNGRGLKYSLDPMMMIKEPKLSDGQLVRGAGNALVVSEKGDAKMLEITGAASDAVLNWVRGLRELALESAHGNRSNPDVLSGARSGLALKLMHQALIWLADDLRVSYGEGALIDVVTMVARASETYALVMKDGRPLKLPSSERYTLRWPDWFSPTNDDKAQETVALTGLTTNGLMSVETGVRQVAETWDVGDVPAEMVRIAADAVVADARAAQKAKDQQPPSKD